MSENDLVTELPAVSVKALHLKDGPLALSYFAPHRTELLKKGYMILEAFEDQCEKQKRWATLWISRNHLITEL